MNSNKNNKVDVEIVAGIGEAADTIQQVIPIMADDDDLGERIAIPNGHPHYGRR